jgi:hypothetical protein
MLSADDKRKSQRIARALAEYHNGLVAPWASKARRAVEPIEFVDLDDYLVVD